MVWGKLPRTLLLTSAIVLSIAGCARQDVARSDGPMLEEVHTTAVMRRAVREPVEFEDLARQQGDVWDRIRQDLSWRTDQNPRIATELKWFASRPDFLLETSRRAAPFLQYIVSEIERRDIPLEIALLPVVESAFKAKAFSRSRASGLWQFIPGTGSRYGLRQDFWYDERRDFIKATDAALDYLGALHRRFNGDWLLALAAYNAGEVRVERAIARNHKRADFWSLKLPPETTRYVPQLLAVARIVANPAAFGITLEPIPDVPFHATIDTGGPVDLARLARQSGIDSELFAQMNASYLRGAAGPTGPFHVYVPSAAFETARQIAAQLPRDVRISGQQYVVAHGDTLSTIALRYQTSVSALRESNRLVGTMIRAGQSLMIPTGDAPVADSRAIAFQGETGSRMPVGTGQSGSQTHRVRSGDTLWQLARRYGVTVEALARANGLSPQSTLHIGQDLSIGQAAPVMIASASGETAYRIRNGDSLWSISRLFKVSITDLRRWNPDSRPDRLRPGQTLRLFLDPDA